MPHPGDSKFIAWQYSVQTNNTLDSAWRWKNIQTHQNK